MNRHLRNLGTQFSIPLPTDEEGCLGRECDQCESYFKIVPGTGLSGISTCHCPYCGYKADQSNFSTPAQIDYATSMVTRQVLGAVTKDLKDMARSFNRKVSGGLFSLKMTIKSGGSPIQHYVEKDLETHVQCSSCTLKYAIYGVFGYCPDCGVHNSFQILETNLELARKELLLAENADDDDLSLYLIGDALENAVSAFDGFGRQAVVTHVKYAANPKQTEKMTFQNLAGADSAVEKHFGFSLRAGVSNLEWSLLTRCFQKRHLLAHKMGVVDDKYVAITDDTSATSGRKVQISAAEVRDLLIAVSKLGSSLIASFGELTRSKHGLDEA